ncbi:MAG: hypothetical protein MUQ65_03005 [Armatimonadetes bacterium]|nr:hypothetical protein [Armatimonadota bacterium]
MMYSLVCDAFAPGGARAAAFSSAGAGSVTMRASPTSGAPGGSAGAASALARMKT